MLPVYRHPFIWCWSTDPQTIFRLQRFSSRVRSDSRRVIGAGGSSVRPANFLPSATIDAFEASSLVAISLSEWDPSKD